MKSALKLHTNLREIRPLSRLRHRFESGWGYHQLPQGFSSQVLGSHRLNLVYSDSREITNYQHSARHFYDLGVNSVRTFTWAGALGATRLSVQGQSHLVQRRTNGRPILPPAFQATHEQRGEMVDQGDFNFEGEFDIEIVAFTKNNPGKTTGWFKLKNDWFLDPKISHLPESAQLLFVKLVSVRAASGNRLVSVTLPWCQRRVGVRSSSCKRNLLILRNAGLISLERKKEREERGDERGSSRTQGLIIPDLVGIDDPLFQTMSEAAQRSWVGKFGLELIRDIVPTAHTSWKTDNPINPRSGVPVPLIPYVHRWLENGKRFPQKQKEKTLAEALEERERRRESGNI